MTINNIRDAINNHTARSAWDKGVKLYALELIKKLEESIDDGYFYEDDLSAPRVLLRGLLNGAEDWNEYSWGGCSLIYDGQIAERLCTPSEFVRTRGGERRPNSREEWLDVQARALNQAARWIVNAARTEAAA